MPDIPVGAQIFDLVFHPYQSTVYTALLTGQVKAFAYDQDTHKKTFSVRPSKRSCRALTINDDGSRLYAAGKGKAIYTIDTTTAEIVETRAGAHAEPINRIKHIMPWLFATGDDAGLWDPRRQESIRSHTQHFDYITDFLWLQDKHHLLATSGDGTLSVMDVRAKKTAPFAQSEDQEDELLSATTIKGGAKVVVGTQLGILSIFNRASGYGDCVDRVPGHPASIDALCALPAALQSSPGMENTILTGSSDGLVRAVQVLPTRLVGVVADHGDLPIERLAIGVGGRRLAVGEDEGDSSDEDSEESGGESKGSEGKVNGKEKDTKRKGKESEDEGEEDEEAGKGQSQWWVGSVGHDEILRLTDLEAFFRDPGTGEEEEEGDASEDGDGGGEGEEGDEEGDGDVGGENATEKEDTAARKDEAGADADSDDDSDTPTTRKRKRKPEKDPLIVRRKKGKNEVDIEGAFFDEL
ncbi:WD40-repeat-containing domain protein [Mycena maculata]|uniref:WD repeat-containing protein JIP5 n=1 Tax=Mycena maculata TaxID=230809 RepID=A0AAD7N7N1_9AGAR|nr:WD40-repeat-containing domain protein [Mycena maculata]